MRNPLIQADEINYASCLVLGERTCLKSVCIVPVLGIIHFPWQTCSIHAVSAPYEKSNSPYVHIIIYYMDGVECVCVCT